MYEILGSFNCYYIKLTNFKQICVVLSNSNMACPSPVIDIGDTLVDAEHPEKLEFGFKMDNVTGVQNLSSPLGHFLLYPNPIYEPFDEDVKYYKSDYLTINVSIKLKYNYIQR